MNWNLLINPIAGSIIGYGTNYLAIKMLFRPHNPVYIGKFRLPFTPGLIPKEKNTIALQIGQTVEEHLLNEDALLETLTSPKVEDAINDLVYMAFANVYAKNKSIKDLINYGFEDSLDRQIDKISEKISSKIIGELQSDSILKGLVSNVIDIYLPMYINNGDTVNHINKIIFRTLESDLTKKYISDILINLEENLNKYIKDNSCQIGKNIINSIQDTQESENIKIYIQNWIDDNFNPMVAMFINLDKLYDKIIVFLYSTLEEPEKSEKLAIFLSKVVHDTLNKDKIDYSHKIIEYIKKHLDKTLLQGILCNLLEEIKNEEDYIFIRIKKELQKPEIINFVNSYINNTLNNILDTKIKHINISVIDQEKISNLIFNNYKNIITKNSKKIVDIMNISALVESKINEFSSQEAEDIILSVVKNQLKGITWIGAILGFIIGILPNIIK